MSLAEIEKRWGRRTRVPMGHGEPLLTNHFRGEMYDRALDKNVKFVYCPVGFIISWNDGDYDHKWCHWCKINYETGISG